MKWGSSGETVRPQDGGGAVDMGKCLASTEARAGIGDRYADAEQAANAADDAGNDGNNAGNDVAP